MAYEFIRGLIDIRAELPTRSDAGPRRSVPLATKLGAVVHYSGPAVALALTDRRIILAEATYHTRQANFGGPGEAVRGDGLQYHVVIGRDGAKYLCRDLEAVLWHCAAWPENAIALAVHVPIGDGQRATPAALRALAEVLADWEAAGHGGRATVKGHQELSPTACPGSLMEDFVRPYRAGTLALAGGEGAPVDANALLEAAWWADRRRLGDKRFAGELRRRDWGGGLADAYPLLVCERGALIVAGGRVVDVTARAIDDFVSTNEGAGALGRF